jgi:ribosomal protein S27AE
MAKIIQRKQQIYRTSGEKGVSTLSADGPGGLRKMKCPSGCGGIATPNQQADQKNRFICGTCGVAFTATPM